MSEREQVQMKCKTRGCTKGGPSVLREGYCQEHYQASRLPAPVSQPVAAQEEGCTCPSWFKPVGRYTHHVECPLLVPFGDMVKPSPQAEPSEIAEEGEILELLENLGSMTPKLSGCLRELLQLRKQAKSQPSTLPQSSQQEQGFGEEAIRAAVRAFNADAKAKGYKYVVDRYVVEAMLAAAWTAAQSQPVAEKDKRIAELESQQAADRADVEREGFNQGVEAAALIHDDAHERYTRIGSLRDAAVHGQWASNIRRLKLD